MNCNIFNSYIKELVIKENNFVYKNNLLLLYTFYDYIKSKIRNRNLSYEFLSQFESIDDIKPSNIEEVFTTTILDNYKNKIYLDRELYQYEDSKGVYFIYDNFKNIIYIGKSNHLFSRAIQSFMNKLPYGATYLKLFSLDKKHIDFVEAVMIDYHMPILNNRLESFELKEQKISGIISIMENYEKQQNYIKPLQYTPFIPEQTLSVFDKINEVI
jgi:hypothetical protein